MIPHPEIPHNPVDDDRRPAREKFPNEMRNVLILFAFATFIFCVLNGLHFHPNVATIFTWVWAGMILGGGTVWAAVEIYRRHHGS